jgi:SNF2 family DNA or RNA helicase
MQVHNNKVLTFTTPHPEAVLCAIPKSKQLAASEGEPTLAVHWGYDEARVLTNLGYKVPAPIDRDYNYPGPWPQGPFQHQKHTAGFLTLNPKCFCFNEMGCGKTASVVWAADYLMQRGLIKRVLIVGPVSILQDTWEREWFRITPSVMVQVAYGSQKRRIEAFQSNAAVVITNHDSIKHYRDEIAAGGFDLIVVDECNAFKTISSARWKALDSLVRPSTWLWMMTGTPASQSPLDAYGLARLVNPKAVPRSLFMWRDFVMTKMTQFKYVPVHDARDKVFAALQPAIRYHKKDCLDLPPVTYETRTVELTAQQKKYYKMLATELMMEVAGATVSAVNAAVKLTKLLQIACGAVNTDVAEEVMEFDCSNRINVVKEIIAETEHKVLIAVPFRNTMTILHRALAAEYGEQAVACINGDVPMARRTQLFQAFEEGDELRILLIQPMAASHGVTLVAAATTIWFSPTMSYDYFAQFNARMDRPGQVNNMTVVQLEGCPVETQLNTALRGRKEDNETLLAMLGNLT